MRRRLAFVLLVLFAVSGCGAQPPAPASAPPPIPPPPDVAAAPADAVRTPSGLASKVIRVGMSNVRPSLRNTVTVHYTGWTADGKMFDSSVQRNDPATFGVGDVVPGWIEGLQLMVVGEKRRFWIPGQLAYDVPGAREDAPRGMLVFDIELLAVK